MSFSIKSVTTKSHIKTVASLGSIIWRQHYTPIIGESQVTYMLDKFQSAKAITNQISEGYEYYILENGGEAIGYSSIQKRKGTLFLSKFYVIENERGKGFGKKAMTFIFKRATELKCFAINLTVNKYNTSSIAAYKRMGFDIKEEAVFDIGAGYIMDDYIMEKRLNSL